MMVTVKTQDAVGMILCHDVTRIIKDKEKGPLFRKGHVIKEEDIPLLLDIGKENLYVWENKPGLLHEDEGAEELRKLLQGNGMHHTQPKEGKRYRL